MDLSALRSLFKEELQPINDKLALINDELGKIREEMQAGFALLRRDGVFEDGIRKRYEDLALSQDDGGDLSWKDLAKNQDVISMLDRFWENRFEESNSNVIDQIHNKLDLILKSHFPKKIVVKNNITKVYHLPECIDVKRWKLTNRVSLDAEKDAKPALCCNVYETYRAYKRSQDIELPLVSF